VEGAKALVVGALSLQAHMSLDDLDDIDLFPDGVDDFWWNMRHDPFPDDMDDLLCNVRHESSSHSPHQ
jgi:hypothetical protein